MTPESLPIEYNITGLANSAATSRMIAMDSASSRFRWGESDRTVAAFAALTVVAQAANGSGAIDPLATNQELRNSGFP